MKKPQATSTASYDVGYGKPPKANQFRKGQRKRGGKKRGEENITSAFIRSVLVVARSPNIFLTGFENQCCLTYRSNLGSCLPQTDYRRRF